jgi:predicted HTH transcriptional regulator
MPRWEELRASLLLTQDQLIEMLNATAILKMLGQPMPSTQEELFNWLVAEKFIVKEPAGGGYVTNLGAVAAAKRFADFPDLSRKALRVIVYEGVNKSKTRLEQEGKVGYAVGFQGMVGFMADLLPQSEVIERALRTKRTVYPEIALRELLANALIHQDFTIPGTSPLVEIFSDRIEISNPGGLLPSKQLDRLIGTQPESRNEQLARAFRRYKICEERGSGLVKAGLEIELYGLPPMEFSTDSNSFKVTLYSPMTFAQMSPRERLRACYQHAVLKYVSDAAMTNTSLRERLKMPEKHSAMVSALIRQALDEARIKPADPHSKSKKFAAYVPYWA